MFVGRYLSATIEKDLDKKLVLLSGPRQAGKTTLAKHLNFRSSEYYNYDVTQDRRILHKEDWPRDKDLIVFDEIHKMKKWKNWLKGVWDGRTGNERYLVTGSARLNWLKRSGDSLAGRFYSYRLHPFSYNEVVHIKGKDTLPLLLERGGFPEAFLAKSEREHLLWRRSHIDRILRDDVSSLLQVSDLKAIEMLVDMLAERVGSGVSYSSLAEDLKVSAPTVKRWIELLENLFVVFSVYPYTKASFRSLRKEPKIYFFDTGRIPAAPEFRGARLENLVATHLLKRNHFLEDTTGKKYELYYVRDKEKREVDFLTTADKKIEKIVEVRSSDNEFSPALIYYAERLGSPAYQVVLSLKREKSKHQQLRMISVEDFLSGLEA